MSDAPKGGSARPASSRTFRLARKLGLKLVAPDELTIIRKRNGKGFVYRHAGGRLVRDKRMLARFASLAVPPAYEEVRLAQDEHAHIQAVGRDEAGRLQYRYHPDWVRVREERKARHLARLVDVLPSIHRKLQRHLKSRTPDRSLALAALIELVGSTFIRAGSEEYARQHGTRGAATLLKMNARFDRDILILRFRAKGGKHVEKSAEAATLCRALRRLAKLPGRRLFQYRDEEGAIKTLTAREANAFLRQIAATNITLKDFRTLCGSATVLEKLACTAPAASARQRNRQVVEAVREAANELANTPTVCRKSYVQEAVIQAFENGALENYAGTLKATRSPVRRAQILGEIVSAHTA